MSVQMIIDRTIADVDAANALKKRGLPFTADEVTTLERGTFSRSTINRISSAQVWLAYFMKKAGYYVENDSPQFDVERSIFFKSDLEKMISIALTLKNAFLSRKTTPDYVDPIMHYVEINKLEQILQDLYDLYYEIDEYAPECGAVSSGDELSVSGVSLNVTQIDSMTVGDTYQLIATVSPSTAINKAVTWSSSNSSIVSVSDTGLLTAKTASTSAPTAIITVKTVDGGFTASCAVVRVQADSPTTPIDSNFILSDGAILIDANGSIFTTSDSTSVSTESNFVLSDGSILIDANSLTFLTKKEE